MEIIPYIIINIIIINVFALWLSNCFLYTPICFL